MKYPKVDKRPLKIVAGALLISGALGLVLYSLAIWIFLPRERIRTTIAQELSRRLNQDVVIEGVTVGFYPDAELLIRGIRIIDPQTSHKIFSARKVRLDPDLGKLLKGEYVLENIVIISPELRLIRMGDGKWNVEKAVAGMRAKREVSEVSSDKVGKETADGRPDLGPIRIRKGIVDIRDEVSGLQLRVRQVRATVDLKRDLVHFAAASISLPPVDAKISGTVSHVSRAEPVLDISAAVRVRKEGPLGDFRSVALPAGATIADIFLNASGLPSEIALKSSFSLNPLVVGRVATKGTLVGTLKSGEGFLEVTALNVSLGQSTLSLAGTCSNIWTGERTGYVEGTTKVSLAEAFTLRDNDLASKIQPQGMVHADVALTARMERIGMKANIDLTDAGLTIPRLMRKQPDTPGSITVDASCTVPDEFVTGSLEFVVGDARLDGTVEFSPGMEPWAVASFSALEFPLASLDRLPSVSFEAGEVTLSGEVWQSSPAVKQVNYRGGAGILNGLLAVQALNEPLRDLNAAIEWDDQRVVVESASFFLVNSKYQMQGEVTDFARPRIMGTINTDMLNINEIVGALAKKDEDAGEPVSVQAHTRPSFSLEMLIEADSIYAGNVEAGTVSATWHTSGESHSFDPLSINAFGGTLSGSLKLDTAQENVRWNAELDGRDMRLEEVLTHLQLGEERASGLLEIEGNLSGIAASTSEDVLRSIEGELRLTARNGELREAAMLKNIFLLMQFSPGTLLVPGLREVVVLNALLDAAKTRGHSLDPTCIAFA
ncbi:MAG: AsmA family protein, partial [Candidatus Hydrogenedentota bacterium]